MKTDQQRLVEAYEQVEEAGEGTIGKLLRKTAEIGGKLGRRGFEAAKGKVDKMAARHRARQAVHNIGKQKVSKTAPDGRKYTTTVQDEWDLNRAKETMRKAGEERLKTKAWNAAHPVLAAGKKHAPAAVGVGAAAYGVGKTAEYVANKSEEVGTAFGNAVGSGVETLRTTAANLGREVSGLRNFGSETLKDVAGFVKEHPVATAAMAAAVPVAISGVRALADKFGGGDDDDEDETDESAGSRCDESSPEDALVAGMASRGCRYLGVDDGLICFDHNGELVAFTSWNEVADAVGA